MEVKDRKDIDVKDTWNLESIYANNELWEEDYAALEKDAAEFAKLRDEAVLKRVYEGKQSDLSVFYY